MPQRVKREARQCSPAAGLCSFAFDARSFHDRVESPTQPVLSARVSSGQCGKYWRIADACVFQKLAFKVVDATEL